MVLDFLEAQLESVIERSYSMKTIRLTQGFIAAVDDVDFPLVAGFNWCAQLKDKSIYAVTKGSLYMHTLLMQPTNGYEVDHRDYNGLNNTRRNLKNVTKSENVRRRRASSFASSPYKGVRKRSSTWTAQLTRQDRTQLYIGTFTSEDEAALAYNAFALAEFGEDIYLNKVPRMKATLVIELLQGGSWIEVGRLEDDTGPNRPYNTALFCPHCGVVWARKRYPNQTELSWWAEERLCSQQPIPINDLTLALALNADLQGDLVDGFLSDPSILGYDFHTRPGSPDDGGAGQREDIQPVDLDSLRP